MDYWGDTYTFLLFPIFPRRGGEARRAVRRSGTIMPKKPSGKSPQKGSRPISPGAAVSFLSSRTEEFPFHGLYKYAGEIP